MTIRPHLRIALPVLAMSLVLGAATQSPHALRRMDSFTVDRVEVHGTRYLAPADVLEAAGIDLRSNVWDESERWIAAMERHPMIRSASIERKLPSTLRVTLVETEPVALARVPTLQPVDGDGRVLPIAPEDGGLDLPILAESSAMDASGTLMNARMRAAVTAFERVRALEPELALSTSEVTAGRDALVLVLRVGQPAAIALPLEPDAAGLRQVRLALEDVARRGEMDRLRLVDGRFRDQVVVTVNRPEPI